MRPLLKICCLLFILSIFFLSCESPEKSDQNITSNELSGLQIPKNNQGLVTFLSGDVEILNNGDWDTLYIGDFVEVGTTVKVYENSFCELQFGETAVVKIQESTELVMDSVLFESGQTNITLNIITGSLLCKVEKLIGNEQFNVKTNSSVCGVRGTEFMVKEDKSGTVLAVREGKVAILPVSVDVGSLLNKIQKEKISAENADEIIRIINKIQESASIVNENEEVFIDASVLNVDATASFNAVEELIDEIILSEQLESEGITVQSKEDLSSKVDAVIANVNIQDVQEEISTENREILNQIDNMRIIEIGNHAPGFSTEEGSQVQSEEEIDLVKIAVKVNPETSVIYLNEEAVGFGNYSGIFNSGEVLNFTFTNEGYLEKEFSVNVDVGLDVEYNVTLELEVVQELVVTAVEDNTDNTAAETFTEDLQTALDTTQPEDTEQEVEKIDETVESTAATQETPEDNSAALNNAEITSANKEQAVIAESSQNGGPVIIKYSVTHANIVGNVSIYNGKAITADRFGIITCSDLSTGNIVYQISTSNNPNDNSFPVMIGNRLYFTGNVEFVIANAGTGSVINKISLDSNTSHAYGQRVTRLSSEFGLFPAHDSINVIDLSDGNTRREINVPNSISMTPIVYEGFIYIVNQNGVLLIIDPESGNVVTTVPTRVNMPVGISVTIQNNKALFAGRMGNVVCYDIGAGSIAWEKELIRGSSMYVFQDIETSGRGVFIFSKGTLFGLSLRNGAELFSQITGVSSPPLHYDGQIFFGSNSEQLVVANAGNGVIIKSLYLGEKITTRPVIYDGKIIVGTESGNILVINPLNM